ncbi:MAG: amidinotransferase [Pseudopedobacter saltans]|uniref:arginine deiminase n=1 Tax=Pseudopedobacter saltans TaxID=151895 RepID=A0A2W5F9I9_9SPHI|nr:MAG: amidinotransferase [Pseudopedobacter saltans]
MQKIDIQVNSEIGRLRRLLIHSPDGGIGKVIPAKFKDWLYDDTVQLSQMRLAYNEYVKLLLYFLDRDKINYINECEKKTPVNGQYDCYKPDNPAYFKSEKVMDSQFLLSQILEEDKVRTRIISAVCAWEGCGWKTERKLESIEQSTELAKVLISGIFKTKEGYDDFLFQPLPNFIFTRDIGIAINTQILLSNAATPARERESLLMRFIAQYGLFRSHPERLLEVGEPGNFFLLSEKEQKKNKVSVEGGDVMMIAPGHLLIGCSERTTAAGVNEIIHAVFQQKESEIEKISVIRIPKHRAMMHIDTVFTQIDKGTWVLFGQFSEAYQSMQYADRFSYHDLLDNPEGKESKFKIEILRFYKPLDQPYQAGFNYRQDVSNRITGLESLLRNISTEDFGIPAESIKILYSGGGRFPYDEREQWTDSCNLLALKEGVVVGYDRNEETLRTFKENGFDIWKPKDLFHAFEKEGLRPDDMSKSLIVLQSGELSRARGGSHCMSFPLLRDSLK